MAIKLKIVERDSKTGLITDVLERYVEAEDLTPAQRIKLGLTTPEEEDQKLLDEIDVLHGETLEVMEARSELEHESLAAKAQHEIALSYAKSGIFATPEECQAAAALYMVHAMARGKDLNLDLDGVCHARPVRKTRVPLTLLRRV